MGFLRSFKRKMGKAAKRERVLIVAISGNHQVNASLTHLASQLPAVNARDDHRFLFGWDQVDGASPQELARNIACQKAIERGADTLLMIDNDMISMGWKTLRMLSASDYDICAPVQMMWLPRSVEPHRDPQAFPCVFTKREDGTPGQIANYPKPGEARRQQVDRVGSGCMAVKRHVIEDPRMLLAPGCDPPALWRNVYEPNFVRSKGLDMDFCDRATALGYRVVVDWDAEIGHQKTANVNDIESYAKAQSLLGYQVGVEHALQMVGRSGGTAEGEGRGPGSPVAGNGEVDQEGMDRARSAGVGA